MTGGTIKVEVKISIICFATFGKFIGSTDFLFQSLTFNVHKFSIFVSKLFLVVVRPD